MSTVVEVPDRFVEILVALKRGDMISVDDVTWLCDQYNDVAEKAERQAAQLDAARPICIAAEETVRLRTEPCTEHNTTPEAPCVCWDAAAKALQDAVFKAREEHIDMLLPDEEAAEIEPELEPELEPAVPPQQSLVEVEEPDDDDDDDLDDDLDEEDEDDP